MNRATQPQLQTRRRILLTCAGSLFALLASQSAHAAAANWTAAADGDWSGGSNWSTGVNAVGNNILAGFTVTGLGSTYTTTLDLDRTVGSIGKSGSANWTITSPTFALTFGTSGSTITNTYNGNSTVTVDTNIILNSDLTISGNGNNNAKVVIGSTAGARSITGAKNITINNSVLNSGGVITINSNIDTSGTVSNTSSQGSSNHRINGVIGANVTGVTQNSARTMILSGANTYSGPTSVSGGVLQAGVASVAGVSGAFGKNSAVTVANVTGSTLSLANFSNQIGSLAGGGTTGGTVSLGSGTLTTGADNTSTTYAGAITGTGGVTKIGTGTQTLNGTATYSGTTTISAGTLALGVSGTIASSTNINLGTSASQGTLDLTSKSSFAFGTTQTIAGYGSINIGAAKAVTINGNLAPGNSPGILSVTGDLVLSNAATVGNSSGAITTMELGGNGGVAGTDFDRVAVSGQVTFGGTLNFASYLGYDINQAASYQVFTFGSQIGSFDFVSVAGSSLSNTSGVWTGTASSFDYTFTEGTGILQVAVSSVPEPGTFALFGGLAAIGFAGLRRRRRSA